MVDFSGYYEAKGIPDAITALMADENAIVISGGTDVLIRIREGKLAGRRLVSIRGIEELSGISLENDETVHINPLSTFAEVEGNEIIRNTIPALAGAVGQAGGPQLRNVATVGGNLCNGACSADSSPTLLTLNAELEITGPDGARRQPLEGFFTGPGSVNLTQGELLTAIRIAKKDYDGYHGQTIKFAQRAAMDIATLSCAVHVKLAEGSGTIEDVRLAFGVAAPTPIRCHKAEQAVIGKPPGPDTFDLFGRTALTEVKPRTSWRASEEFRRQLVYELAGRALGAAIQKAKGEAPQ